MKIISGNNIVKCFGEGDEKRAVINELSIDIPQGEFVRIMGPSGSGKSTLMYALSGMETIDSGNVIFQDVELAKLKGNALADIRRSQMGFDFQQPTFLKNLNLFDNIILPAIRDKKMSKKEIIERAEDLMSSVGISELKARDMSQVSGGQLQRAGICRALVNSPKVIFGDEPTGALNSSSSLEIMKILTEINKKGTTIILVTHDAKVSAFAQRILFLSDGKIVDQLKLDDFQEVDLDKRVLKVTERMMEIGI